MLSLTLSNSKIRTIQRVCVNDITKKQVSLRGLSFVWNLSFSLHRRQGIRQSIAEVGG